MTLSTGFPPVERADASVLVLGSLPGQRSIDAQQYYAHPQNAFWRIMHEIYGIAGEYDARCLQLTENGIALWDVLRCSIRPGSMDADIQLDNAVVNDFPTFLGAHGGIRLVAFNGRKAQQLFARFVQPLEVAADFEQVLLPSTSPAYAAMPFSSKLAAWRRALINTGGAITGR
jgi:hypoxanthine-DNA glycosylase